MNNPSGRVDGLVVKTLDWGLGDVNAVPGSAIQRS